MMIVFVWLLSGKGDAQIYPQPANFQFDSTRLIAYWQTPRHIALDETFEFPDFPAAGWQVSGQGLGWAAGNNGSAGSFSIPAHTHYAYINNQSNPKANGCCDWLITPELDLTQADGYTLTFDSYFPGRDAETASVQISLDGGTHWDTLLTVLPHFAWGHLSIDLSSYSGISGYNQVLLAFAANDHATASASGWAIDNVQLCSAEVAAEAYQIYCNGLYVGQVADTDYTIEPSSHAYGMLINICIKAVYDGGAKLSECSGVFTHSGYLYPPRNLYAEPVVSIITNYSYLTWQAPLSYLNQLTGYNLYRNGAYIATIPKTNTSYWDLLPEPGHYCYTLSSVYDLSSFGYIGMIGESLPEGPKCIEAFIYMPLNFTEDWTPGQFDVNLWTPGNNWRISGTGGNPLPAAEFNSTPIMASYESTLTSFQFLLGDFHTTTPYCFRLDFDYLLNDSLDSGTEALDLEVFLDGTWTTVKSITNQGSTGWVNVETKYNISNSQTQLKFRFRAHGQNSSNIHYWLIDNIHQYIEYDYPPAENLTAMNAGNTQQNDISLSWEAPIIAWPLIEIEDDSTFGHSLGINPGYTGSIGNKFTASQVNINAIDLGWQPGGNSTGMVSVDLYDSIHHLIGSSQPFCPVSGSWQRIGFDHIPVDNGFYAMLRFDVQSGCTHTVGLDSLDGSNRPDCAWFFDGSQWQLLSSYGFGACALAMRAEVEKVIDCEGVVIESAFSPYVYPLSRKSHSKMAMQTQTGNFCSYKIYRREYNLPLPGQDSLLTDWQHIATTDTCGYYDRDLEFKCYQYYLKVSYPEGYSSDSNVAGNCFVVSHQEKEEQEQNETVIRPIPANESVEVRYPLEVAELMLLDMKGSVLQRIAASGTSAIILPTAKYAPGSYFLRFVSPSGESFYRKLLIVH